MIRKHNQTQGVDLETLQLIFLFDKATCTRDILRCMVETRKAIVCKGIQIYCRICKDFRYVAVILVQRSIDCQIYELCWMY